MVKRMNQKRKFFFRVVSLVLVSILAFQSSLVMSHKACAAALSTNPFTAAEGEPAQIVGELTEYRDEYTKTFRMSDGTRLTAQYPVPVHYQDTAGAWLEYDNTMQAEQQPQLYSAQSDAADVTYQNRSSDKNVRLAKRAVQGETVTVSYDGHIVSWGFVGGAAAEVFFPQRQMNENPLAVSGLTQKAVYANLYQGVDLECLITPQNIKENLILQNSQAPSAFTIEYRIGELTAVQTDARTIELRDEEGAAVSTITAPVMTDAAGVQSDAVSLAIVSQQGGTLTLQLTADSDWLGAAGRAYPVTVDPDFSIDVERSLIEDAYYCSGYPNRDYCSDTTSMIRVGHDNTDGTMRGLLRFKELRLPGLPSGASLVKAELSLSLISSDGDAEIGVFETSTAPRWYRNNVTWNTAPICSLTPVDYVTDSAVHPGVGGGLVHTWDITSIMRKWQYQSDFSFIYPNFMSGLTIASLHEDEHNNKEISYFSSGYQTPMESLLPLITMQYVLNEEQEQYGTTHSNEFSTGARADVNDFNGNLTVDLTAVATTGTRLPFALSLGYNREWSSLIPTYVQSFGAGWGSTLDQKVVSIDDESLGYGRTELLDLYDYVYIDARGRYHYLKQDGTAYTDDDNTMTFTLATGGATLSFDGGTTLDFALSQGRYLLSKETDSYGNTNTFVSNGTQMTVTDGAGRTVVFQGTTVTVAGDSVLLYTSATDPAGRVTYFDYNDRKLSKIRYPNGGSITFEYQSSTPSFAQISKIIDTDGSYVSFERPQSGTAQYSSRAYLVKEYDSANNLIQQTTIDYRADNTTKFTYDRGDGYVYSEVMLFDELGRTVGVAGENWDVSGTDYVSDGAMTPVRDKVRRSYATPSPVVNLLKNPGAEEGTASWYGSYYASSNSSKAYLGQKSFKLSAQSGATTSLCQDIDVTGGESYTLSAYVNCNLSVPSTQGAYMRVSFRTASGASAGSAAGEYVQQADWERMRMTFTAPENAAKASVYLNVTSGSGDVWFDDVQLEQGKSMNDPNLLQNAGFSGSASWSTAGSTESDGIQTDGTFLLTGDTSAQKSVYQTVPVNKNAVCFTFSGKAKAPSVPIGKDGRDFSLSLTATYADNTTQTERVAYVTGQNEWQTVSGCLVPDDPTKVITSVRLAAHYDHNVGNAYFDDMMLSVDQSGVSFAYDEDGNLIKAQNNDFTDVTYQYDADGNVTSATDSQTGDGAEATYDATVQGQLNSVRQSGSGVGVKTDYDAWGNMTSVKTGVLDENGELVSGKPYIQNSVAYNAAGNYPVSQTDERGNVTQMTTNSNTGLVSSVKDPKNNILNYTWNAAKELPTAVYGSSVGGTLRTTFTYDSLNRLDTLSHNVMNTSDTFGYQFQYDLLGNLAGVKLKNAAANLVSYGYEGSLLQSTDYANGDSLSYEYDAYGNVTGVKVNGTLRYEVIYDLNGRISSVTDHANANASVQYYYGPQGSLEKQRSAKGALLYTQDPAARTSTLKNAYGVNPSTLVTHTGDGGLVDTQTLKLSNKEQTIQYEYDDLQRLTKMSVKDGDTTRFYRYYNYAAGATSGTTSNLVSYVGNIGNNPSSNSYKYDANGNIVEISSPSGTITYEYDAQNQLIRENDGVRKKTVTYLYYGGNLTSKKEYAYTTGTLGAPTSTTSYTYDTVWKDQLKTIGTQQLTYDALGNPLTYRDGMNLTWEGRQLAGMTKGGVTASYVYDANGLRTKKTVDGASREIIRDAQGSIVAEVTPNGTLQYFYGPNGERLGLIDTDGSAYYYVYNVHGDVTGIVSSTGSFVVNYTYDTWGKLLSTTGSKATTLGVQNPFRYRGYYYDTETGLYYLQSRYYDPETGRFLNADDFRLLLNAMEDLMSVNLYAYCKNNPVINIDPHGFASYRNVITYHRYLGTYQVTTYINVLWKNFQLRYAINNGVVSFDFRYNDYWGLLTQGGSSILATAIYNAARSINGNYLSGRTSTGIHTELLIHFAAYKAHIKYDNAKVAQIGGTSKSRPGYDSNAWVFEVIANIKATQQRFQQFSLGPPLYTPFTRYL